MLIHDPTARAEARQRKTRQVLGFLRTEIWTTPRVVQELLGLTLSPTLRFLRALEREGLVALESTPKGLLIGITPAGQAHAAVILGKPVVDRVYGRGRAGLSTLEHRCALQLLRIRLARAGWVGWQYPDRLPPGQKNSAHRPDAMVTTPGGERVAVEVELTFKTSKRYRFVVGRHVEAVRRGDYTRVIYYARDEARTRALHSIFAGLGHVVVGGRDVVVTSNLLNLFSFTHLEGAIQNAN